MVNDFNIAKFYGNRISYFSRFKGEFNLPMKFPNSEIKLKSRKDLAGKFSLGFRVPNEGIN